MRNVIVMHEDVTEEKRAEDEARAATAELSQVKHAVRAAGAAARAGPDGGRHRA